MKLPRHLVTFLCVLLFVFYMANIASAVPPSDFAKPSSAPKFSNVDVVVECEWSPEPIKSESVNVIEITKNDKPTALLLMKGLKKESELSIVKGVTIKIYDHDSGELLKTYKA